MPLMPDASFEPDVDVDDSKKYIGELEEIEERDTLPQFKRRSNQKTMIHKWRLFDTETGVAVIDNNTGDTYQLWQFVDDQTYSNEKTGKIAPAREIANALLNRTLSDEDVRQMVNEGWSEALVGQRGIMDLEWYTNERGYQRLRVLRVKPYRKPRRQEEPVATRQRITRLDDDDEEPG
jgi:hypothetical protein